MNGFFTVSDIFSLTYACDWRDQYTSDQVGEAITQIFNYLII